MVEQAECHCLAGLLQAHRQVVVLAAWLGVATGVVVGKDNVWCSGYESMSQYQAYVHGGFRYASTANDVMSHELVLYIQQEQMALLVRYVTHLGTEEVVGIAGGAELGLGSLGFKQEALAQFHCRLYGHGLGRPYAVVFLQLLARESAQGTKTVAMLAENLAHEVYAGNLRCAAADEYSQEFGIAHRFGTESHDTLARSFVVRPVLYLHVALYFSCR